MPEFVTITLEIAHDLAASATNKWLRQPDHDLLLSVARERARQFVGQQHTRSHVCWSAEKAAIDWLRKHGAITRRQMEAIKSGRMTQDDPRLAVAQAVALDDQADQIEDEQGTPADSAALANDVDLLRACLGELPERERDILLSRADGVCLKELAAKYGVSVQRVDQIYKSALAKLAELVHSRS